jgi:post-segregation antitoxin (ccd killing protein)
VKKTLTIPSWLNQAAEAAHINFSGVLQEALKSKLNIG